MKEKSRIIIFIVLLFGISLINIFASDKVFSDRENRFLASLPAFNLNTLISGTFNEDFKLYASDQFVLRDRWIGLKSKLDLSILKKDNGRVYFGKDDYLFDVKNPLDKSKFLKKMTKLNNIYKMQNQPFDLFLVPSKSTIYSEKLPYKAPVDHEEALLEEIRHELDEKINLISPVDTFNQHKEEGLYYKTDHHYTSLGAYYAYRDYVESINLEAYSLDSFDQVVVSDDFLGSLYRKSSYYQGELETIEKFSFKDYAVVEILVNGNEKLMSMYDDNYLNKADKYSYFLDGDHPLVEITTKNKGQGTLVVIKDSFANSMIPFLTLHFEKIIMVDERYYNLPLQDFLQSTDYDRVLYLFNLRSFYDQ